MASHSSSKINLQVGYKSGIAFRVAPISLDTQLQDSLKSNHTARAGGRVLALKGYKLVFGATSQECSHAVCVYLIGLLVAISFVMAWMLQRKRSRVQLI